MNLARLRPPLQRLCLGLTCSVLLACSDGQPDAQEDRLSGYAPAIRQLYQQALDAGEDSVVLYTAFPDTAELWESFNRDFPGIRLVPAQSQQIYTRLQGEERSGKHTGDLVLAGYSTLAELVRQERLEQHVPEATAQVDAQYLDPQGYYQLPWVNVFALVYNTNLLSADQVPERWETILDPHWKQRFGLPRFIGASPHDAALILVQEGKHLSDEQLLRLRDQAQVTDNNQTLIGNVAQGRLAFGLWVPAQSVSRLQESGAPVALRFPREVAVLYGPGVALLKHAPHPNAARLFKNWLFSEQAQAIIARREYAYGTLPGAPVPEGYPPIDSFEQIHIPYDQVNDYFDRYRKKTQSLWQ